MDMGNVIGVAFCAGILLIGAIRYIAYVRTERNKE